MAPTEAAQAGLLAVLLLAGGWAVLRGPGRLTGDGTRFDSLGLRHALLALGAMLVVNFAVGSSLVHFGPRDHEALNAWLNSAAVQLLAMVGTWLGPLAVFIAAGARSPRHAQRLGLHWTGGWTHAALIPLLALASLLAVGACGTLFLWLGEQFHQPRPEFGHETLKAIQHEPPDEVLLRGVGAVVMAPLVEEVAFRGLLQTSILGLFMHASARNPPARMWTAIVLTALLFAAMHTGSVPWQMLPGLFLFGVVLGWTYERTGSLWTGIGLHACYNAAAFAQAYWLPQPQ